MGNPMGFWGTPSFFRNTPNWTNIPSRWGWVNTYGTWSLRAWGCIGLCFAAFIQCCFPILCLILEIMVDHHLRNARLKTQLKGSNSIKLISSNLYRHWYKHHILTSYCILRYVFNSWTMDQSQCRDWTGCQESYSTAPEDESQRTVSPSDPWGT